MEAGIRNTGKAVTDTIHGVWTVPDTKKETPYKNPHKIHNTIHKAYQYKNHKHQNKLPS